MMQKSIGDLLTEARVKKGLQLVDIAKELDIDAQYLLIMELSQFSLIPAERLEEYLTSYAAAVDLDGKALLNNYYNKEESDVSVSDGSSGGISPKTFEAPSEESIESIPVEVAAVDVDDSPKEEMASSTIESEAIYTIFRDNSKNSVVNNTQLEDNISVKEPNHSEESVTPLLAEEKLSTPSTPDELTEDDRLNNQETMIAPPVLPKESGADRVENRVSSESRSRHRSKSKREVKKQSSSFLPIFLLSLLAIAIVVFIAYFVINQSDIPFLDKNTPSTSVSETTSSETTDTNEQTATTEASNETSNNNTKTNLEVSGGGDSLTVNVTNGNRPVEVVISLDGVESSWVALTNSSLGEGGIMLDPQNTSYTATLTEGATSAELTLGVSQGVVVTVNGEKLDTSLLEGSPSYITFTIE
ncbi:helix-turn-helix domain-containing protein [Streptococcus pacificus]|uniref:Helix-turn-helix domain-containing protein n=1 Tax=Streptococcus pacificus TaxID=2740577 RepID=A0ABS0ZKR8_9STRE|nr:helix-turn-helix transcriptional regulator [Streptococcus pacificus]MBJ8326328.1 helix-turn-helix domain-containing protein [Streptococcus pacificus]